MLRTGWGWLLPSKARNATAMRWSVCVGAYSATESGWCNYERFRRLDTELEVAECAYGGEQSACCVDHHLTNASAGQKINPARETHRFGRLVHLECKHHPQAVLLMHRNLQQSQRSFGFKNSTQQTRTSGILASFSSAQLSSSQPSPLAEFELAAKHNEKTSWRWKPPFARGT